LKKLTDKQLVNRLRQYAEEPLKATTQRNMTHAADLIEKQQAHIKRLQEHRLVPVDMQPRRGTVEPDNTEVITLDFETTVLDSTEKRRVTLYFEPLGFGLMVMALLHAMGFPEGDLEYVRERLDKELRPDA
jgi:hypothetical protein